MATLKTTEPIIWAINTENTNTQTGLWAKYLAFADGQKSNRTLWFFISLLVNGIIILPVPAVLMYYFNAPVGILAITMLCFFTNLIANMGGAGIRTTITTFFAGLLIHLAMIVAVII